MFLWGQANDKALRPLQTPVAACSDYSIRRMAEALAAAGKVTAKGNPLSASTVALRLERLGLR